MSRTETRRIVRNVRGKARVARLSFPLAYACLDHFNEPHSYRRRIEVYTLALRAANALGVAIVEPEVP